MVLRQTRFLLLRGGAIGDFMLTLPAIRAVRERWPDAHLELIGYPHVANLALSGGLVDAVLSLDAAHIARLFSLRPELPDGQIKYIRSFDVIITWLHDPDGVVRDNLLNAGARQVIYGSPMVGNGHAIDHLLKPLEALALYDVGAAPALVVTEEQKAFGRDVLSALKMEGRVVALHPGSGSPKKNWSVERYVALAGRLAKEGKAQPLFLLGEADQDALQYLAKHAAAWRRAEHLELGQLAGLLACCAGYVGNDSGITHLAAAIGIPVVALFGPTDPDRWGPRGAKVTVLRAAGGDMEQLGVDQVYAPSGLL